MLIQLIKNLQNYFLAEIPILKEVLFSQIVIYIFEHNNTGSMSMIINKPVKKYTVETILNNLKSYIDSTQSINSFKQSSIFYRGPLFNDQR